MSEATEKGNGSGGDALAKADSKSAMNIEVGVAAGGLVPTTFEGLYRMASIMSASKMMPTDIDTPEKVFVALQAGLEVGLSPMAAVQNIAVINGRPSMWGDSVLALVRASGKMAKFTEKPITDDDGKVTGYRCHSIRTDGSESEHVFTIEMAKRAGLLEKKGPWQTYRERMLQMRSRSWVLRDLYPDILRGLNIREEVEDYVDADGAEVVGQPTVTAETDSLKERLANAGAPNGGDNTPPDTEPDDVTDAEVVGEDSSPPADQAEAEEADPYAASRLVDDDPERPSNWVKQYNDLRQQIYYGFEAAEADDPKQSAHDTVMAILGSEGATSIDELAVNSRPAVKKAMKEAIADLVIDDEDGE